MGEWTPAVILALVAFLVNQYVNWHKERRDRRKESRDDVESADERYRRQVDGIIAALERRVVLAEKAEMECVALQQQQESRMETLEGLVDKLSRKLAQINGE